MPIPQTDFGYLPDRLDPRDWDFSKLLASSKGDSARTIADKVDWRSSVPEILDQEELGSCVAHGVLGAIRLKHTFKNIPKPKLGNRLHVYRGAREYIGMGDWDSGSHIRDAFRFINAVGFMPEEDTKNKYDIRKYKEMPSPKELRRMYDQRNDGKGNVDYYRVTETNEERKSAMKFAMSNGGVPVLGTETTQAFLDYRKGILRRPEKGTPLTGGHAFYLVGYTGDYVIAANSWDDDWGLDGFGYLGWDYITWENTRDIWIVQNAPYFSGIAA